MLDKFCVPDGDELGILQEEEFAENDTGHYSTGLASAVAIVAMVIFHFCHLKEWESTL